MIAANKSFNGRRRTGAPLIPTLALPVFLPCFCLECMNNFAISGFGCAARHQVLCAVLSQPLFVKRQTLSLICSQRERTGAGDYAASAKPAQASDSRRCGHRVASLIVGGHLYKRSFAPGVTALTSHSSGTPTQAAPEWSPLNSNVSFY